MKSILISLSVIALANSAPPNLYRRQNTPDCSLGTSDRKQSGTQSNPPNAFAPFDVSKIPCTGFIRDTGVGTTDEVCESACSDGKFCRAPDALKGVQTCRSGVAPSFGVGGALSFVTKAVSDPICGGEKNRKTDGVCAAGQDSTTTAGTGGKDKKASTGGSCAKIDTKKQDATGTGGQDDKKKQDATTTGGAGGSARQVCKSEFKSGVPKIEFGQGFPGSSNAQENRFQPDDLSHGAALNAKVITQFICSVVARIQDKALQTKCNSVCDQATAAANAQPDKTKGQADAFNAVFDKSI